VSGFKASLEEDAKEIKDKTEALSVVWRGTPSTNATRQSKKEISLLQGDGRFLDP
jgi:hypothetical protein